MIYVGVFLLLNFCLTYLFSPQYGTEIYGTTHELFRFNSRYTVTLEQILYQLTKILKYASGIPSGDHFPADDQPQ